MRCGRGNEAKKNKAKKGGRKGKFKINVILDKKRRAEIK